MKLFRLILLTVFALTQLQVSPLFAFSMEADMGASAPAPEQSAMPAADDMMNPEPEPEPSASPANDMPNGFFSDTLSNATPEPEASGSPEPAPSPSPEMNMEGEQNQENIDDPVDPEMPEEPPTSDELKAELAGMDIIGMNLQITYIHENGQTLTATGLVADNLLMYTDDEFQNQTDNPDEAVAYIIVFQTTGGQTINLRITSDTQLVSITEVNPEPQPLVGLFGVINGILQNPPVVPPPPPMPPIGGGKDESKTKLTFPIIGFGPNDTITEKEGTAINIKVKDFFRGDRVNEATFTVSGLPPGLSFENGYITGVLPLGSAGYYTIHIVGTVPGETPEKVVYPLRVVPNSDPITGSITYFNGLIQNSVNQGNIEQQILQTAQQTVITSPATAIETNFVQTFAPIANIPYINNYFNCDSFATATLLGAANTPHYVYEFTWAINANPSQQAQQTFNTYMSALPSWISNQYQLNPALVYHQMNIVWVGRTEDMKYDIYRFYEPQTGSYVGDRFLMPASDQDPTSVPAAAFNNYIQASGYAPNGYTIHPTLQQTISNTPTIHPGNYEYYNPLTWYFVTQMYLPPSLAQQIQAGVPGITQHR